MAVANLQAYMVRPEDIRVQAFIDRGFGCNIIMPSSNGKSYHEVTVDLSYRPVSCSCGNYQHVQKKRGGMCKHMIAWLSIRAGLPWLLDSRENPILKTLRKDQAGAYRWVYVRFYQLSEDERRAAYCSREQIYC